MNGQFLADPIALDDNGTKLQGKAGEFREDVTAIYNTVEDMIVNDYISKEAVEKDYEKETGLLIVKHFMELGLNPSEINMVLCGGHGPFAWGETAAKSVYNGTVMEEICKMALNTLALNPNANELPSYIVDKHYLRKHGPNAYYGQK